MWVWGIYAEMSSIFGQFLGTCLKFVWNILYIINKKVKYDVILKLLDS